MELSTSRSKLSPSSDTYVGKFGSKVVLPKSLFHGSKAVLPKSLINKTINHDYKDQSFDDRTRTTMSKTNSSSLINFASIRHSNDLSQLLILENYSNQGTIQ